MIRRSLLFLGMMVAGLAVANPVSAQVKTQATSHDLEGKDNCLMCHAVGVMEPVPDIPASHEGRAVETCVWCHAPDAAMVTTGAPQTTHDLAGKENCLMCHAAGVMEPVPDVPASHEGRAVETCLWCHTAAGY